MLTKATHTDLHALLQKKFEHHGWCLADLTEKGRSMPLTDPHTIVPTAHEPWGLIAGQDLGAAYVVLLIVDHGMILEIGTLDRTLYSDPWARLAAAGQGEPLLDVGTGPTTPEPVGIGASRSMLQPGSASAEVIEARPQSLVVICGFFFNTHYHGCSPSLIISPGLLRGERDIPGQVSCRSGWIVSAIVSDQDFAVAGRVFRYTRRQPMGTESARAGEPLDVILVAAE